MDALDSSQPIDTVSDEDLRADSRSNGFLAADIVLGGESFTVRLRNVSTSGALVESKKKLKPGTKLLLKRSAVTIAATVVRTEGTGVALTFDEPIDEEDLTTLSRRIRPDIVQPLYR